MLSLSKSSIVAFAGLFVSTVVVAASDEQKFYVQFNAGAAFAKPFSEDIVEQCLTNVPGIPQCNSFSYKEKTDTGYAASVALGYHLTDQFRLEGEALYQSNDLNSYSATLKLIGNDSPFKNSGALQGERERTAFLLNAYYDFKNISPFTPYITGGVGGYHLRIKASRFNDNFRPSRENDLDFAWQVGAGLNYRIDERISFDLKYRYFSGSNAEITIPSGSPFFRDINELHQVGDHQIMAGIRVGF